ncbi:hypothetical protein IWX48DRAFT_674606, partial [Phyllosticta citricarpa]
WPWALTGRSIPRPLALRFLYTRTSLLSGPSFSLQQQPFASNSTLPLQSLRSKRPAPISLTKWVDQRPIFPKPCCPSSRMVIWGEGVFQSEGQILASKALSREMDLGDEMHDAINGEEVRQKLNDGRLQAKFCELKERKWNYRICVLAAAAMEVGAELSDEFRAYAKKILREQKGNLGKEALENILEALIIYNNGIALRVGGLDQAHTAWMRR